MRHSEKELVQARERERRLHKAAQLAAGFPEADREAAWGLLEQASAQMIRDARPLAVLEQGAEGIERRVVLLIEVVLGTFLGTPERIATLPPGERRAEALRYACAALAPE